MTAQSSLQSNCNASPGAKVNGTKVPRPVVWKLLRSVGQFWTGVNGPICLYPTAALAPEYLFEPLATRRSGDPQLPQHYRSRQHLR